MRNEHKNKWRLNAAKWNLIALICLAAMCVCVFSFGHN